MRRSDKHFEQSDMHSGILQNAIPGFIVVNLDCAFVFNWAFIRFLEIPAGNCRIIVMLQNRPE